jgi:hypothetical protein
MPKVSVSQLVEDFDLYPRTSVSDIYINELAEALRAGMVLPPIWVDKESKRIVDGLHRSRAHAKVFGPDAKINVQWKQYESEGELLADAIATNANHGRRMCKKDIVRCAHLGGKHGLTLEAVASLANLTPEKLEGLVADRTGYTEDGEPVPLVAGLQHLSGKKLTKLQRKANRNGFGNVNFFAKRLADLLEANAMDLTSDKLVAELMRLRNILNQVFEEA